MQAYAKSLYQNYPNDTVAVKTYMEVMLLAGDPYSAKSCYETIAKSSVRETLMELGIKIYLILDEALNAKKIIDQVAVDNKNSCSYNYMCGVTYRILGNLEASIASYELIDKKSQYYLKAKLEIALIKRECGLFEPDGEVVDLLGQFCSDPVNSAYDAPNPFTALHFELSEIDQRKIAENSEIRPLSKATKKCKESVFAEKIKLAYVSPDFRNHAVGYLIEPVLKNHDREKFYLIGVDLCSSPIEGFRKRLLENFDKVIKINDLNTETIDIAVDLAGPTRGSLPGIFESRIAAKQLVWLGYPGTSGRYCYDGIIADKYVIPRDSEKYFTEPVFYLPDCYQPFDGATIAKPIPENIQYSKKPFKFASLNNPIKINYNVIKVWSKILIECANAELSIFVSNKKCAVGIESIFKEMGINPDRFTYMYPATRDTHLERISDLDLVLDTWPYNGHTTTQDALRCNVPVLTVKGDAFQARVAESVLRYVGLPEFVAEDTQSYIVKAVSLYDQKTENANRHDVLATNRPDIRRFVSDLEALYESQLYE
jgi:predicted O-linked N-acetylglucosamine transferase (SPINDLY family)